jgi:hypothetical protein
MKKNLRIVSEYKELNNVPVRNIVAVNTSAITGDPNDYAVEVASSKILENVTNKQKIKKRML